MISNFQNSINDINFSPSTVFSEFNKDNKSYLLNQKGREDSFVVVDKNNKYSADDGEISPKDKFLNFCKGIVSPIKAMFSSPKNMAISVASIAAIGALTIATGGAIAPFLVAAGVAGGAVQLGTSAYKASKATTDEEARQAWQGIGAGTTAVVGSVAGAKGALKTANVNTQNMNFLQATVQCFKQVPNSLSKSFNSLKSNAFLANIKNTFSFKKKNNNVEIKKETKNNSQIDSKAKNSSDLDIEVKNKIQSEVEAKRKADISQDAYKQKHEKQLSNKSAEESAKVFEDKFKIQDEVQVRKQSEIEINRKIENSQAAYELRQEKNLSHKSAEESAKVFEKKLDVQDEVISKQQVEVELKKQEKIPNSNSRIVEDKTVSLIDKSSHNDVTASIISKKGNHSNYRREVIVGDKVVGISENNIGADGMIACLPDDYVFGEKALEIKYLATSEGYKGSGSQLIKIAVEDSMKAGCEGKVFVDASGGSLPMDVGYLCGNKYSTSPVPFYYKMGFRTISPEINQAIEKAIAIMQKTGVYDGPSSSIMYLPDEAISSILGK